MNEIIYAEGQPLAMREEKFALNSDCGCSVFQSNEQVTCVRTETFLSHLKQLGTGPCLYLSRQALLNLQIEGRWPLSYQMRIFAFINETFQKE